ncbi:hypothetical protein [Anaerosalibacter massiliensis]|uniref:hypothetical protein n=1 Tax=Anaerosalibacter massiliensis TaxID=1347392 RepID=UPI0005B26F2B|nr:hypothetical protein [Anaerosalibacter massiliensis]
MKILTSFAYIKTNNGGRIAYTYDVCDEKGNIKDTNVKESFLVIEQEFKDAVANLGQLIENRMNEED